MSRFTFKWPWRKRWSVNPFVGTFSLFEHSAAVFDRNATKPRVMVVYLGLHYQGADLTGSASLLRGLMNEELRALLAAQPAGVNIARFYLQVFRLPPLHPYPAPGASYADYARYRSENWYTETVMPRAENGGFVFSSTDGERKISKLWRARTRMI